MINNFKEYLKNNNVITDGAMGTYYSSISNINTTMSESASITDSSTIYEIHKSYIEAGANLIRTNTFSSNSFLIHDYSVSELIVASYTLAKRACGELYNISKFVACSIGPIPTVVDGLEISHDSVLSEYKNIVDTFLSVGASTIMFETFSSIDFIEDITKYIKDKNENVFIITSFALTIDGTSRRGYSYEYLLSMAKNIPYIDAYGINCGIGPFHSKALLEKIAIDDDVICCLPNAGYPQIINERYVYSAGANYFAGIMQEINNMGVKIIGGCCGTTPEYIKEISSKIDNTSKQHVSVTTQKTNEVKVYKYENSFKNKLINNEFVFAVELGAPIGSSVEKFMSTAKKIKDTGADILTIADSPFSRARVDSIILASKVKREIGIEVMPHLCCRDRNIIGLKSHILGGYVENIRNMLVITGDAIASPDRNEIKSVFNVNAFELMNLIKEMNLDKFPEEHIFYGGAISLSNNNLDLTLKRISQKVSEGASYFMTQPIFNDDDIELLRKIKDRLDVKILAGIMPIVSLKNALFLDNEIPGINVDPMIISKFRGDMTIEESCVVGTDISVKLAIKVKDSVDGLYIMTPFHRAGIVGSVIDGVKRKV